MQKIFYVTAVFSLILFFQCSKSEEEEIIDTGIVDGQFKDARDGKSYQVTELFGKYWMAENLSYKPKEGNTYVMNDDPNTVKTFGYLYDWETACKVCPEGWHLPTLDDWKKLMKGMGMDQKGVDRVGWIDTDLGGKLKSTDPLHWETPNKGATDELNFNARGNGIRGKKGSYSWHRSVALFWIATEYNETNAWQWRLKHDENRIGRGYTFDKTNALSVRCVQDDL